MTKTIRVTGKANLSLEPDETTIIMNLSRVLKDYESAVKDSRDKTEELKNAFEKAGFKRQNLKTRYFNIDTEYESYKKGDNWYKRFKGYRYQETLVLDFDTDNHVLTKAVTAISGCEANPEFSIQFSVKNKEEAKDRLLKLCVKDAIRKGEIIANAAGLTITGVNSIDYSYKEIDFRFDGDFSICKNASKACATDFDIDPENIEVNDSATVIFEAE